MNNRNEHQQMKYNTALKNLCKRILSFCVFLNFGKLLCAFLPHGGAVAAADGVERPQVISSVGDFISGWVCSGVGLRRQTVENVRRGG